MQLQVLARSKDKREQLWKKQQACQSSWSHSQDERHSCKDATCCYQNFPDVAAST